MNDLLSEYLSKSSETIGLLKNHIDTISRMAKGIHESQLKGNKLLVAGNGGSCADAQHFVGEMTCTFKGPNRRAYSAISLAMNSSAITAWTNDFGFDSYFSRQVEALGKPGDVLFLISTGGGDRDKGFSMNLVSAADKALEMGLTLYSLIGKSGGELKNISNEFIIVPSTVTAIIQQAHITIIHSICECLEVLSEKNN